MGSCESQHSRHQEVGKQCTDHQCLCDECVAHYPSPDKNQSLKRVKSSEGSVCAEPATRRTGLLPSGKIATIKKITVWKGERGAHGSRHGLQALHTWVLLRSHIPAPALIPESLSMDPNRQNHG